MASMAIIGGGPGGLMTAYLMRRKHGGRHRTTIFEASPRVGGKLMTRHFDAAPVPYEAGAAEVYDYSHLGHDPLKDLVDELGLTTQPMSGQSAVIDGKIVRNDFDIERHWGPATLSAIRRFRRSVCEALPADAWGADDWQAANGHPWARRTCAQLFDTVLDPVARKYLEVTVHSDLATEPHLTNGLNGLHNLVMDEPGYLRYFAIDGGMARLADALADRIPETEVRCDARVVRIGRAVTGWRVSWEEGGRLRHQVFDAVVVALPIGHLGSLECVGSELRHAMGRHVAEFDRPGHYLRVSLLFDAPFWADRLSGSWFMIDAFSGTCVYDESSRFPSAGHGVLGFLLAGNDALAMSNAADATLLRRMIEALPAALQSEAGERFLEARVHRWGGAVSGQPGGLPMRAPEDRHRLDARRLPGLFLVGDYLFDSTLNGVHRSADLVSTLCAGTAGRAPRARPARATRELVTR